MRKMYWDEYPRPQMKREGYMILNGEWKLNGQDIIMPFPPQSVLSGYNNTVDDLLVYEKIFSIPNEFIKERVLLHFGAVDQVATIWLNDKFVGSHAGGYLPFSFDVTDYIIVDGGNRLKVEVEDFLLAKYPYGKQAKKRGGMWYTQVSGIWQTVWLENVPQMYIKSIKITPDMEGINIKIDGIEGGFKAIVSIPDEKENLTFEFDTDYGRINLKGAIDSNGNRITPKLWNLDNPYIYNMRVITKNDEIMTYFALRTIDIRKVDDVMRVCLNGKPIFLHGVLDQGYYQDGIYLPQSPKEFERDILRMKELGFNTLRKHIKIEPEWFYYYCDMNGMLVIQDMVNSGVYSYMRDTVLPTILNKRKSDVTNSNRDSKQEQERKEIFEKHMKDTIGILYNHPCIVVYTIFNEGWGQFDSDRLYEVARRIDGSRLYDSTSGWFVQKKSDFESKHVYFVNRKLYPQKLFKRPMILSECGGYTYPVSEHMFNNGRVYGYGKCKSADELTRRIWNMYKKMVFPIIEEGLCGCIYTQLSDVEDEINGMYTYDREICKVNKKRMLKISQVINKLIGKN